jgi:2'-5' RNA ligase
MFAKNITMETHRHAAEKRMNTKRVLFFVLDPSVFCSLVNCGMMEPMNTQSGEILRLFIAVDLSAEVRAVLRDVQSRLQHQRLPVRWVDPAGAHLTLKFLGAVEPAQVEELTARLHDIAGRHRAFTLRTGALGAFPTMQRLRVVWLAIDGNRAALQGLQEDVERTIAPLGFPSEQRAFSPHLTLGRTHKDVSPTERAAVGRAVAQQAAPPVGFDVGEIVLMRSELGPSGARYTPLVQATFSGSPQRQEDA